MRLFLNQVTIIGVGLIGGSIARALKEKKLARRIVGCSQSIETLEKAKALGIIDSGVTNPADAVKRSELVIIATPLSTYRMIAEAIGPHLKPDAVLTDVGSVKQPVIEMVTPFLRRGQRFIPAHPIAGSEKSGVEAGNATLFHKKRVIITPAQGYHSQQSCDKVTALWESLGAEVELMDAAKHDRIYAAQSHAIQLLSYAYAAMLEKSGEEIGDNEEFAGFMRLAGSDKTMWRDIFSWNAQALSQAVAAFEEQFSHLLSLLKQQEDAALLGELAATSVKRAAHKDEVIKVPPARSYSQENALFAYSVVVPKLVACAAYNAFTNLDYAGSGFWGFTQMLLENNVVTDKRLAAHRGHILRVGEGFVKELRLLAMEIEQ